MVTTVPVRRIFSLLTIDRLLDVYPSLEEARGEMPSEFVPLADGPHATGELAHPLCSCQRVVGQTGWAEMIAWPGS